MAFVRYFDEGTRTVGEYFVDESLCATCGQGHDEQSQCPMAIAEREDDPFAVRESFDRIRRTRACYRCGASPEHCDCLDEMEPDGARG